MEQYKLLELSFPGPEPERDFAQVDLTATFSCGEHSLTVPGFYAGNGIYKVRFLPQWQGVWNWTVTGVVEASGQETCVPGSGHGLVKAEQTHFRYEDGTLYWPIGTTVYALAHQSDERIAETMDTLRGSCFNKIRICLFPKWMVYNRDEPALFPFERDSDGKWDVRRPCFAFWDRFERCLTQLAELGIQTDLILFHPYDHWGFSRMSQEEDLIYVDYLLRRFAAMPSLWWSLANEYDTMFFHTPQSWEDLEQFVAEHDPFGHLLSNHNWIKYWDFSRPSTTHVCLQTQDVYMVDQWVRQYGKPVMIDECCYEGTIPETWGNISAFELVNRFWCVTAKGGFCTHGETYWSEDEVLWWAKGGVLKGESPVRLKFLSDILSELPGPLAPVLPQQLRENPNENQAPVSEEEKQFREYFRRAIESMGPDRKATIANQNAEYKSFCDEQAYLTYYAHKCLARDTLHLPENHRYRIEVMDVWNMTRETVLENVNGTVTIPLPGKEGIALLATATEE
ncbi:MAG: DUF5060 domain-containing protein [Faecousia sp.]